MIAENRAELQRELADAAQSGDVTLTDVSAGVNVGLIQSVDPAAEIVRRTVAEAETVMRARCSELLRP